MIVTTPSTRDTKYFYQVLFKLDLIIIPIVFGKITTATCNLAMNCNVIPITLSSILNAYGFYI